MLILINKELWLKNAMYILTLTFLPSLLILLYVTNSDKFKEPTSLIISTFFLGCLLCFPAGILNGVLIFNKETPDNYSFLAGFSEETLKFLALYFYVKNRKEFDEPMDAVVYGCLISLGFATYENYEYVYLYETEFSSLNIAVIRALSAIPLHACCGIIMGYYFIFFHFKKKRMYLFLSLLIPICIHAFYNFLTNIDDTLLTMFIIGLVIFTISCHKKIKKEQSEIVR